jgi:hypothetical protein
LAEFGVGGALIVAVLIVLQLLDFFKPDNNAMKLGFWALGLLAVIAFGVYTRSFGRPMLLFLILIMMPLATTEIGTDGWITAIMEGVAKAQNFHPGWVLVYTSAIMLVLRFFAGPIVHQLSPLGLLAISALLAMVGLRALSTSAGLWIFLAATLYGFGKTFFWPTMLGVVAEQFPKGGALTLNAISGIGMLAVGTLGTTYIGVLQTQAQREAIVSNNELQQEVPGLVENGQVVPLEDKTIYEVLSYKSISDSQLNAIIDRLPSGQRAQASEFVARVRSESNQLALRDMAVFPAFMLVCYLVLILYFRAQGGYKAVHLGEADERAGHAAADEY